MIVKILKNKHIFFLISFLFLFYQILFFPTVLEKIVQNFIIPKSQDVEIDFKIQKSSLFTGFEIQNFYIKDKITQTKIIHIELLKFKYFLPSFFVGKIGISEILLQKPQIFLYKRDNIANYRSFLSKKKEAPKEQKPLPEVIKTYLPLKFHLSIKIDNLEFAYLEEIQTQKIEEINVKNLSFDFGFETKRLTKIPLNPKILNLFQKLSIGLDGLENLEILVQKLNYVSGKPILSLKLAGNFDDEVTLISTLNFDTNNSQVTTEILNTKLKWNLDFSPESKILHIHEISISDEDNYLLFLKGELKYIKESKNWYLTLRNEIEKIQNQKFSLDKYGRILNLLTNGRTQLSGNIFFEKLVIDGYLDDLAIDFVFNSDYFNLNRFQIRSLDLKINGLFYLKKVLSFLYEEDIQNQEKYAFGFIKNSNIKNFSLYLNDAYIHLKGEISEAIKANLNASDFQIGMFTQPFLMGKISGNLEIIADKEIKDIVLKGIISMDDTKYQVDEYYSKFQTLFLNVNGNISLKPSLTEIQLLVHELSAKSPNPQELEKQIFIEGKTKLSFFPGGSSYEIFLNKLDLNYNSLESYLPSNLRFSILPYAKYLSKKNQLSGNIFLKFADVKEYKGNLNLLLSSFHPEFNKIEIDISQGKNFVNFQNVIIKAIDDALFFHLNGKLEKNIQNAWVPNINLTMNFQQSSLKEVFQNVLLSGIFSLRLNLIKDTINGELSLKNLNAKINLSCENQICKYFEFKDLNLKLPFKHILNQATELTYQSQSIESKLFTEISSNLTLSSIVSNYSFDNLYFQEGFPILGKIKQTDQKNYALQGFLEYKNNILWIPILHINSFFKEKKNGDIQLKNFYLKVSDAKPQNMEMGGEFYIIQLDLNSFFPKGEGVFKGTVSGFVKFYVKDFGDFVKNLSLNITFYELSKDFSGFLVRIVSPKIVASVVNNTLSIENISLELKEGLVYSTIGTRSPGFFSLSKLISPSEDEIRQERIPLGEFIKRSKQEIME